MPLLRSLALALLLAGPAAAPTLAQDFSPVIVVNDRAVTGWELDQRTRLLTLFGTAGDVAAEARTQLVDDRLKSQEFERVGAELTPEQLDAAIEEFTGRAGLAPGQFEGVLAEGGVAPETLRDYVEVNTLWRDYIRARFGESVVVSEDEIDRRLAREAVGAQGIEVLLSEIIIAAPPPQAAQARAIAEEVSRTTSLSEFEAAAREYSAVASREQGGQLDWAPVTNYPPALREALLGLEPGQVTPPLELEGAVALLQLRDVREGAVPDVAPEAVDYAQLRIPGGRSDAALSEAARVGAVVDTCDDLYVVARGRPDLALARQAVAPGQIDGGTALDLAALDPGEATWGRVGADGSLLLTMLCARTYPLVEGAEDREQVRTLIIGDRLTTYADALLADLRAAATIVGE